MKKALVKETGEVKDVKSKYNISKIDIDISFDFNDVDSDNEITTTFTKDSGYDKEGTYYVLSDDVTYNENDLIVGQDNIREEKLKNIIE